MKLMRVRRLFLSTLLVISVNSIGCGGGSDTTATVDINIPTNACSTLGLNLKVINGSACQADTAPVARIVIVNSDGTTNICSGTLITDNQLLSAAHCFLTSEVSSVLVELAGRIFFSPNVTVPSNYRLDARQSLVFNDFAILELDSGAGLQPLPILVSESIDAGDIISIFGFGIDDNNSLDELNSGGMLISDVTETHILAEFNGNGSNACNGDSGGPALITTVRNGSTITGQVGIVSSGRNGPACQEGEETAFTNLQDPTALDFIARVAPAARFL